MTGYWVALAVAVSQLILAEVFDWSPRLAARLVRRAAQILPPADRARYEEEWLGELDGLPGRRISTLVFAIGILINAPRTRRSLAPKDVATASEDDELKDAVASAIQALPDREKIVVALANYEGLSTTHIAQVLEISPTHVTLLHTRALGRMRRRLLGR